MDTPNTNNEPIQLGQNQILNMDLVGLHEKNLMFKKEVEHSQSASSSGALLDQDVERFNSYLEDQKKYLAHITAGEKVDLPKFTPKVIDIKPYGENQDVNSEFCRVILRNIEAMDFEMVNSSSARDATNMKSPDKTRYESMIKRIEDYIKYVNETNPLDRPESSPTRPVVRRGQLNA